MARARTRRRRRPPPVALLPWSLTDGHGPWCAWCLKYFAPELLEREKRRWLRNPPAPLEPGERRQEHHVIALRDLNGRVARVVAGHPIVFDTEFPESWTVHVHERCHQLAAEGPSLQEGADKAAIQFNEWLAKAQQLTRRQAAGMSDSREFKAIDEHVLKAFESGRYSVALLLNEAVRTAYEKLGCDEEAASILNFQLSARTGIRGKKPLDISQFAFPGGQVDPRALLHIASHHSLVGNFAKAREILGHVESLPLDPALDLDLALRKAQIDRSPRDAHRALDIAADRDLPYRRNTALVIAGFIDLANGARSTAQGHFEAVLDMDTHVSWLYRAESWLGLGLVALDARRPTLAYRHLIAAQYVYGFLGLQPLPHPGLPTFGAATSASVFYLLRSERLAGLSREACHQLRREAIEMSSIKEQLTGELSEYPKDIPRSVDPAPRSLDLARR